MKKRDWFFIISLILIVWGLDRVTKVWALDTIVGFKFYGPVGFVLHRNPGAMLGMFSDLPPVLRIVSLSTGGAFLIFIYTFIQYLLPKRSLGLRSGMSILLGGILGNVHDRILWGSVVDFITLGSRQKATPAFNVADALQWVGYGLIVVNLIKEGNQLWPNENERKQTWVNPKFQRKYILKLMAIGAGFATICGTFSYTYLKVTIDDLVIGRSTTIEHKFIFPFLVTFGCISGIFMLTLFIIGRILSHRTAGPIYAFELFLKDLANGKDRKFKLRAGDEFVHLEQLAEIIRAQFKKNYTANALTKNISDEDKEANPKKPLDPTG